MNESRSSCPINLSVELLGDAWTLLILRDMIFGGRRHFRELLLGSQEGIASNILADRLRKLVERGLLTKRDDPTHKQKAIYSLTESAIALIPVFAEIGAWGSTFLPVSEELSIRSKVLHEGGPRMWEAFMAELREKHLGIRPRTRSRRKPVSEQMEAAYEAVIAGRAASSPRPSATRTRAARSAGSSRPPRPRR